MTNRLDASGPFTDLHHLTAKLARPTREPVALIGIGCRFPGQANSPAKFWQLLKEGVDALIEIPDDRWDLRSFYDPRPSIPGKTNIRFGGFVESIDRFDPEFFGISPREANRMDPQQRLLLEVAWEALEDGGQVLDHLQGSPTGVFVGVSSWDYTMLQAGYRDRNAVDVYTNTGGALSIAANRISYSFDFKGPSLAVDSACSSGLTAVHLACRSIWEGECQVALAGAVNMLITPGPYLGFSMLSMLSPDGRCKAFDARANGFVRSEGAGMVLLKPLSRAIADGDQIYAVVRGTAINQDGTTSGLTVPSQSAQRQLIGDACRNAGIEPHQVQFVEAHGTGTLVGDPIEARALGEALCIGRSPADACRIGSVKTNIGHLESAAGIAGLIKVALALKHHTIPANLHFQEPNPEIDFKHLALRVPTETEHWPMQNGTRLAGVNSFGFGGSNAHLIVEGYHHGLRNGSNGNGKSGGSHVENWNGNGSGNGHAIDETFRIDHVREAIETEIEAPTLIPISARSPQAVKDLARLYAEFLNEHPGSWKDFLFTVRQRRTHHEHRGAIVAATPAELATRLIDFADGERQDFAVRDRVMPGRKKSLVFVCAGQGPQWWAMGRELLHNEPVFRAMIEQCDTLIRGCGASWSLLAELSAEEADSRIGDTAIAQPAIFAVQVGLAKVWEAWGVVPDAVIGHSVGEVAAAYIAGVLSLDDAVRVIYHRGRSMALASKEGGMLAVGMTAVMAQQRIGRFNGSLTLAAINGPQSLTISGDMLPLKELAQELEADRVFCKFLRVNQAFHSRHMDPAESEILAALSMVTPGRAKLPLVSTVTGDFVAGPELDAQYWWRNIRQTVRFAEGTDRMLDAGHETYLELSPHPVLVSAVTECALEKAKKVKVFGSLRRQEPEQATLLKSLGSLFCVGHPIDWKLVKAAHGHLVRLPSYPWQREVYWHEAEESRENRLGMKGLHPLLGRVVPLSTPLWQSTLSLNFLPYLRDHQVQNHVLVPGTAMLEMALAVGKQTFGAGPYFLEDVKLLKAIFLNPNTERLAQTTYNSQQSTFQIRTGIAELNSSWTLHCSGQLRSRTETPPANHWSLEEVLARCPQSLEQADCYQLFEKLDIKYGPTFQGIRRLWRGDREALGEIEVPAEIAKQIGDYQFHPAILDACLQCVFGTIPHQRMNEDSGRGVFLPVEMEEVRVYHPPTPQLRVHARLEQINGQGISVQLQVYDLDSNLLVDIRGLKCQYVGMQGGAAESLDDLLYAFKWRLSPRGGNSQEGGLYDAPALPVIAQAVTAKGFELPAKEVLDVRANLVNVLNRLAATYVTEALQNLGLEFVPGTVLKTADLLTQLKIAEQHHRVFSRYLAMLAEEGILVADGADWRVIQRPEFPDSQTSWRILLEENPAFYAELTMIRRCAGKLAEVLVGDVNPLQLIFPEGSLDTAEHLYQDSPSVRIYNKLAQQSIAEIIAGLPHDRMIRILEIGAGTGGLTSYLLPHLPAERTQYVFTDLSNHFFNKGKQKFADYPFLEYRLLNIEQDPLAQGYDPHSFDIIIASQVLHATKDLQQTLEHVRCLMSKRGLLVLLELLKPARWVDLVFGLTEGWWHFTDLELRPEYPLLPFAKWEQLLHSLGFSETVNVADGQQVDGFGSAVILSRGPEEMIVDATVVAANVEEQPVETTFADNGSIADRPAKDQPICLAGDWLIFADCGGVAESIAEQLRSQGGNCQLVRPGKAFTRTGENQYVVSPTSLEDFQQLLEPFIGGQTTPRILHFWNLDAANSDTLTLDELGRAHDLGCLSVVHLFQAWSKVLRADSQTWVITRNAQSVFADADIEPIQLAQTNVWGLCRVLFNEYSKLRGRLIDLAELPHADVTSLLAELSSESGEDEVALRGMARYVNRYSRSSMSEHVSSQADAPEQTAYRLETAGANVLDALTFRAHPRTEPDSGQIEIEVRATALNFSDVMKSLGLYPGLPDGPVPLGIECAGRVTAVGADVSNCQVGDDVIALAPFAFASHVITHSALSVPMPKHLTYEEATTMPITFLTAYYSLVYLGRLSPGERVLIHSAAGGVGLAAIQVAQEIGAEIYVTAGSTEKREFLQSLGIKHVMDSRSLQFADEIMELTNGEGVDVVLNSLSGEAINKSLSVLGEYGRFLEIGKRDIYMNSPLGMRPFKKNVSFMAIDLDRVMRQKPELLAQQFQHVMTLTEQRRYRPLPHRVFSATNIKSAFRYMAQAKHLGKVVVSFQDAPNHVLPAPPKPVQFRADATYFISGGLGGFGLLVARWMAEQGARNFVLMGRRGIHSPEAQAGVDLLRHMGAEVLVVQGNVADAADVDRAFAAAAEMPPIRGVLHAAMHLEDCLLNHLDRATMLRVVEPKMLGAWNLHKRSLNLPLDFFVSFSSMGSVFGMPGQANYAAGNLFLDTLPYYRRRLGKPGLTINWGYLREVGYVAERADLVERFESQGFMGLSPREALALLGRLMVQSAPQVSIVRMDWSRARDLGLASLIAPRFRELTDRVAKAVGTEGLAIRRALLAVVPEKRKPILLEALRAKVATVLGASPDKVDLDTPLTDVGVDSLMAVELRNWVEGELRVSLPIVELMEGPSVDRLADILLEQLAKSDPGAAGSKSDSKPAINTTVMPTTAPAVTLSPADTVADEVSEMSDADVDALLDSMLESRESS